MEVALVGPAGLEPATKWLWVTYSNQLSYGPWLGGKFKAIPQLSAI